MRNYIFVLTTIWFLSACSHTSDVPRPSSNSGYNAALAKALGADEYGMKSYILVTLMSGPEDKNITDKAVRDKLFRGHFANMSRLADEGKLVVAGPLMEARPKRGLYIFNTDSVDTARTWVFRDPAVSAGIFTFEADKFYSSAALQEVGRIHETLAQKKIE